MKRLHVVLVVGFVAALAAVGTSGGASASAAGPLGSGTVQRVTVGTTDEVVALQVDKLLPGSGTSARFLLQRGPSSGGSFAVSVDDVEDLERGCSHPERRSGDVTCDDAEGELSQQLLVAAGWSAPTDCDQAAAPGGGLPMASITDQALLAQPGAERSDAVCLALSLELPITADNLVQSDAVRFSLRLGLQDATPQPIVPVAAPEATPDAVLAGSADEPPRPYDASDSATPGSTPVSGGSGGTAVLPGGIPVETSVVRRTAVAGLPALPFTGGRAGGLLVAALCSAVGASLAVAGRRRAQAS